MGRGDLRYFFDLILVLTQKEIKIRYKNSLFGYLWSIAHPLAFAFVFFVAFKVVMRIKMEDYTLFLIVGLFPWQWFSNSVNFSPSSFLSNATLIKKLNFPRSFIPLSTVLNDMIHFILSLPVLFFFLFFYKKPFSLSFLYGIPILLFLQFLITYGTCLFVSSLNLFFRDLERLVTIFTTFLFYFTPVIYSEEMIPERYRHLLQINPLFPLMVSWRNLFLSGKLNISFLFASLFYGILSFLLGYFIYKRLSYRFAEVI